MQHRFFGGIPADDEIDCRVADEFVVEIGRRETAEDDRSRGVQTLDDTRHFDRAVCMGQPVQVDAERRRIQPPQAGLDVEVRVLQHAAGKVHDARVEAVPLEILSNRSEPDRIHFEDRR